MPSKIVSYGSGLRADARPRPPSTSGRWKFGPIALLWRGGCIIRAVFLQRIKDAFDTDPKLENLSYAVLPGRHGQGPGSLAKRDRHGRSAGYSHAGLLNRFGLLRWLSLAPVCRPICSRPNANYFGAHTYLRTDGPARSTATGCVCGRSPSDALSPRIYSPFEGQTAVVIGGAGVLGFALAKGLGSAGAHVIPSPIEGRCL